MSRLKHVLAIRVALPIWMVASVAVVGLAIGGGIGGAGASGSNDRATSAERRADEAEELAEAASERAAASERRAAMAAPAAEKKAEAALASEAAALDARANELDTREADLQRREKAFEAQHASSFDDGVYEVGRDIQAGKYRAMEAGSNCYWAKLRVADDDIIDNDLPNGPTTVVIQAGIKFQSKHCGTWTKIG